MKKVLSIFMAILMVVTMFSFSAVVFAEEGAEPAEKESLNLFIGNKENFGWSLVRQKNPETGKLEFVPTVDAKQGTTKDGCWNVHIFNPETVITNDKIAAVQPTVGTGIADKVSEYAASGEYSKVVINVVEAAAETVTKFIGLKGTADCPIVIASFETKKTFENNSAETTDPAIIIENCEYVVLENVNVSALNNGIVLKNCSNVTIKNVSFEQIGYVDYLTPSAKKDAEGKDVVDAEGKVVEVFANMDTSSILERGASVLVGAGCVDATVEACSFTKCRAGVVADGTALAEGEVAAKGVNVLECAFTEMTDAAVYAKSVADVTVSGGSVVNSGTLSNAEDYDGRVAAAFVLDGAENVTIERVYSTDNASFINAKASTGRVRYNVSDRDGSSKVDAAELLVYNNTFVAAATLDLTATVKNNIFDMNMGEKVKVSDGDKNCYHWTSKGDRKSIRKNPQFANAYTGAEEGVSVRDNYILSKESPCLGAGVKVEDDMGTTDFYGNAIGDSINIGADQGAGVDATRELTSQFADLFNYIIAVIKNFFANLFA